MFLELYFLRWGVETKYNEFKNRLQIENFTGRKPETLLQNFYAAMYVSNIVSIFKEVVDSEIEHENKDKTLKYVYQANRNYLIGYVIKEFLMLIQLSRKRISIITKIINRSMLKRSEVRPNRTFERRTKHPRVKYKLMYKNSI
jgi:cellulose synthase/poly-beta-1,6-N-acetylglucosamine synthase-like glycosyltransferase